MTTLVAFLVSWSARRHRPEESEWAALLLEQVHDAVIAWRRGRIIHWNRGAEDLYGWSKAEATGRPIHDLLRSESVGGLKIDDVEPIVDDGGRWAGQIRQVARDGRPLVVESRMVLVRGKGDTSVVLEANHDITARVAAERARQATEERLHAIVETAADAILTIDGAGVVNSWNAAAERLFGYRADEVIGQNVAMLMPEPFHREHDGYLARYQRTGERRIIGIGREVVARRKDGTTFPIELAVGEAKLDPPLYTGILRDITARKQADAEREALLASERAARSEAECATRRKDDFIASVSHELRTPLGAILSWVGILERSAYDPGTTRRAIDILKRNGTALAQMVEDLLDTSRIVAGKIRLEIEPCQLVDVVDAALAALEPLAETKRVRLERHLDPDLPKVFGDPGRLQQVVTNLVSNAVKFTPGGGAVRVALRAEDASVKLVVSDTGQGIAADLLPHVFERFRQGDSSGTGSQRGLGLGLALVQHFVEAHGGRVDAESDGEGRGATFTVTLPVLPEGHAVGVEPAFPNPAGALRGLRVLVVDDEEDARETMCRILVESAAEVRAVGSAQEALAVLRSLRPDVIVSDIGMPNESGFDLMRSIRRLPPEQGGRTPAATLTGLVRPEDQDLALAAGYQLHLAKPIDAVALVRAVAGLARLKLPEQAEARQAS